MKHSTKTYICKTCGAESKWAHQKMNVYCSNACSARGMFLTSIEKFNRGEISCRETIRKILSEVRGYKCEICKISEWEDNPITLQVDHINGNAGNNLPTNLRLICPNCHSQTPTFRGRKVKTECVV